MEESNNRNPHVSVRELCWMALCAAVIAVCSWISLPAAVPYTLQTFAVFCTLLLLGGRNGSLAIGVYILLGAAGLPVFSGFRGGIGVLLGTTGGYIAGFLLTALVYRLSEKLPDHRLPVRIAALLVGLLVCYAFGTAWFMVVYTRSKSAITLGSALTLCVLPFVLPDLLKLALAVTVSERMKKSIPA